MAFPILMNCAIEPKLVIKYKRSWTSWSLKELVQRMKLAYSIKKKHTKHAHTPTPHTKVRPKTPAAREQYHNRVGIRSKGKVHNVLEIAIFLTQIEAVHFH
jgi:hypothetical protein